MPICVDFLPDVVQAGRVPLKTVAVIVQDDAEPFGLGSLVEVWGEPEHPEDGTPVFDFRICTPRPGRVRGRSDFDLYVERGLEATEDADLVAISPKHSFTTYDPQVREAVVAAHDRAVRILPPRHQLTGQLPLLFAMVAFTVGGLYLLFAA